MYIWKLYRDYSMLWNSFILQPASKILLHWGQGAPGIVANISEFDDQINLQFGHFTQYGGRILKLPSAARGKTSASEKRGDLGAIKCLKKRKWLLVNQIPVCWTQKETALRFLEINFVDLFFGREIYSSMSPPTQKFIDAIG